MKLAGASGQCVAGLLGVLVIGGCHPDSHSSEWQGSMEDVEGRTIVHNPDAGLWAEGEEWEIREELRLGVLEGDPSQVFGAITALAVSPAGEIAVLDGLAREVRVFAAGGEHLRTFGRAGQGPGEFQGAAALHFDPLGRIWVVDIGAAQYHLFDGEGRYVRSHPRDPAAGFIGGNPGVQARAGFFEATGAFGSGGHSEVRHLHVDTTGAVTDSVAPVSEIHRTREALLPFGLYPFIPRIISTVDRDGGTWLASTEEYRVYRRTPTGDTIREIRVARMPSALSAEQEDTISAVIARFSSPVAPPVDRRTAGVGPQLLRSLLVDDQGRLFVRPATDSFEDQDALFEVFDSDGRYLGRIHWDVAPARTPPPIIRDGLIYTAATDPLGFPIVVRGRVVESGRP